MTIRIKIKVKPGYGNYVSKSERKVSRKFLINKQKSKFYSHILKQNVYIRGNTNVFRDIAYYGGIDHYLLLRKVDGGLKTVQKMIYRIQNSVCTKQTKSINENKD